jgi:uncharacterized RDD family membrane protein YckC
VHPDNQVVTGEAVAVELRLAGAGSRGVAALIDLAIVTIAQLVLIVFLSVSNIANVDALTTALILTEVLIVLGYPVAMETLWRGRTLGKATMGLRVVRDDGGPIRFRHAFVRGLVGVALDKPGVTFGLGALIPMTAGSRKKRLGDLAAGTIVLQDRVPGRLDSPIAMPPPLAGWAAGLDLSAVDDGLALRIRHFLSRSSQLTPAARATLEHQLASEAVARVGPPPANTPGWAVITAVLAERRRRAFTSSQAFTNSQAAAAQSSVWAVPIGAPGGPPQATAPPAGTTAAGSAEPATPPPPSTTGFAPPG